MILFLLLPFPYHMWLCESVTITGDVMLNPDLKSKIIKSNFCNFASSRLIISHHITVVTCLFIIQEVKKNKTKENQNKI